MKRLLPAALSGILLARVALATTSLNFINTGVFSYVSPPQASPQIDANTFINYGFFSVSNLNPTSFISPVLPFESWNTFNYTNYNLIFGDPGFRFDLYDSATATHHPAANFVNAGSVSETNATIFGATYLLASANNIVDRGLLAIGGSGLLKLSGDNVDLARGLVAAVGNDSNPLAGVRDIYWGAETNLTVPFANPNAFFAPLTVTEIQNQAYLPTFQRFQLTNGFTTFARTNFTFAGRVIDLLFLGQTNSAITTQVRFSPFDSSWGSEKVVQWQGVVTNRATGGVLTNYLYLSDTLNFFGTPFPDPKFNETWLVQTPSPFLFYGLFGAARFHPINYAITHSFPQFTNLSLMPPVAFDPGIYNFGTNVTVWSTNTGWAASITAQAFSPDPTIQNSVLTNVPGRFEITANSNLDLTRVSMDQESYLRLESPNHFLGSAGANIISPYSDFNLGTTNGFLAITNLTTPSVPRMNGEVQVWSGRWTTTDDSGLETTYNVSIIDSRLAPEQPSQIQDLTLRSTNVVINDVLNVYRNLLIDCERLTIATNALDAPTTNGALNLTSPNLFWAPSLPRLQYLTNYGIITAANSTFFGGARVPPWFSGTFDEPYQSFVNHGSIMSQGSLTWANYLECGGGIDAGVGPLSFQCVCGIATNSVFTASNSDVSITAGVMLLSNTVVQAGRAINLNVTNILSDGIPNLATLPLSDQLLATVTNGNGWQTGFGITLASRPLAGDLLGTTITNFGFPNTIVPIIWGAKDRGRFDPTDSAKSGFLNNAVIGHLILDGQDNSVFRFSPAPNLNNNALYVDCIEFRGWAASHADVQGNLLAVSVDPNMKVYFAQALANGRSIAEKLDGQSGGRFIWLSNYNYGYFSSTNLVYPDGSTNRVNAALAQSGDIDSDGDGTVNSLDPSPVPNTVWSPTSTDVPSFQAPAIDVPTNGGGNGGPDPSTNAVFSPPKLGVPPANRAGTPLNTFVQGSYTGLFSDTNGVAGASSGYFVARTTTRGAYSGKVTLAGRTYPFSGRLDNSTGLGSASISRGPFSIQLWLVAPVGDQIIGRVVGQGWSADLLANRQVSAAKSSGTGSNAGRYTMLIPPDTGGPAGYGFATVKVSSGGNVQWAGTLADGSKVAQSSALSSQGFWPMFASVYGGQGGVIGWEQFASSLPPHFGGQSLWFKPAGAGPRYYPQGFTNEVEASGALYTRPRGAAVLPLNNGQGSLIFSGGGLHAAFTNTVTLDLHNRVTSPSNPALKFKLNAASGLFSGSVSSPPLGLFFFQGALLENGNFGAGSFLGPVQSGEVYLGPAP
jgi:hypothetical protein